MAIYRSLGRFRGDARLSTWIYRIAARGANRMVQRRRLNALLSTLLLREPAPAPGARSVGEDGARAPARRSFEAAAPQEADGAGAVRDRRTADRRDRQDRRLPREHRLVAPSSRARRADQDGDPEGPMSHHGSWLSEPANEVEADLAAALEEARGRLPDEVTVRRLWSKVASPDLEQTTRSRWPWFVGGVVTSSALAVAIGIWLVPVVPHSRLVTIRGRSSRRKRRETRRGSWRPRSNRHVRSGAGAGRLGSDQTVRTSRAIAIRSSRSRPLARARGCPRCVPTRGRPGGWCCAAGRWPGSRRRRS